MKFKKGDKVQFIEENQLITGQITDVTPYSTDNFTYLVAVPRFDCIESFRLDEDRFILKKPLVSIPKFVADYMQKDKTEGGTLYKSLHYIVEYLDEDSEMYTWLEEGDNGDLYAKAWLDGYEIEKEPLYYVKLMDDNMGYLNRIAGTSDYSIGSCKNLKVFKTKFTEREIKAMDERFWAFAVPVEEVEETK
ncbi:DUF1642 domain-containing protein [Listeria monocytogenes]|nr:DUF1642 domain-containing protein [Listeria monocytogenes]EDN9412498.1 DUF1642 domain-containing protein [Listeria monocytogenes]